MAFEQGHFSGTVGRRVGHQFRVCLKTLVCLSIGVELHPVGCQSMQGGDAKGLCLLPRGSD